MSEPGPCGNMRSSVGSSTLTDFSCKPVSASHGGSANAVAAMTASGSRMRIIIGSSARDDGSRFDDVAHKATGVPVGCIRLCDAVVIGAADHQQIIASGWQREADLPLAEAVFALVVPKLSGLPRPSRVGREIDLFDAGVTAERDTSRQRSAAGVKRIARLDVGDER